MGEVAIVTEGFEKGAEGAKDLACAVIQKSNQSFELTYAYDLKDDIELKIKKICNKIYGAKNIIFEEKALLMFETIKKNKFNKLPVVIAKTQYSFSDNKELIGAPNDFDITIRDLKICSGAGFVVAIAGNMLLMPGLGKHSAFEGMIIDSSGEVHGLY